MKIAVLGAKGFVGSSLAQHFTEDNLVIPVTRETIDLLDGTAVREYLRASNFDVVINAAAVMTKPDNIADTRNNLGIFMNFYNNSSYFGRFINLGSGAEFDRTQNINCASETDIFDVLPADSYGFGQNLKSRLCHDRDNFYTMRIFNCFGSGEIASRIFPKFLNKNPSEVLQINNDRYFDYFSIQDLCTVAEHYVYGSNLPKDVNCVYQKKYKISEALRLFCQLQNIPEDIYVASASENNYTGSGEVLSSLNLPLTGLEYGFKHYG